MNVTLSLDDALVKEVRKIADERDTTLTWLIRDYPEHLAEEHSRKRKHRQLAALERSFEELGFRVGKRTWNRADLFERS